MCTSEKATGASFPARRPLFYYITDRHQLPSASIAELLSSVERAVSWGVDFIQLREKDLSDLELLALTKRAVQLVRGTTCSVLVNGRLDIALAGGAQGVHIPSAGLEIADLKPYLPRGFLLGASTHSLREASRAAAGGANYILLGPIFRTASKVQYGKPLGLIHFKRVCSALSIPALGLGGLRPDRICRVLAAGASGVAGITLFQKNLQQFSRDQYQIRMTSGE